ncbi:hypothetical protein SAMN05660653_03199 [Desulfonatronum thiosulfatophilum]|uniref:Phage integrase, N-terminal SAM-like domain n=1 Tax=Desulfonatronum thiosulfatophilum TaxID=617002 RepID=A0A1G6EVL3_9BACT|nr:hypothetical protein SAMN05660653_03199 [Desulfonatronum thiosulfatophilum]
MEAISAELQSKYKTYLLNKASRKGEQGAYLKWLRHYLDYCRNTAPPKYKNNLPLFIHNYRIKTDTSLTGTSNRPKKP